MDRVNRERDTDDWVERLLVEHWRGMTPAQKGALVTSLSRAVHELSLAGIRLRHPEADARELFERAACLRLGPDLFERVTGRRYEEG